MTVLDQLQALVGIGAPTVALDAGQVAHPGDVLRGVVVLQGGDNEVPLQEVTVRLEEQRLTYTDPVPTEDPERHSLGAVAQVTIDLGGLVLASGQRLERPFELQVPAQIEPSTGALGHALVAEVELTGVNPVATLPMTITPREA